MHLKMHTLKTSSEKRFRLLYLILDSFEVTKTQRFF